MGICNSAHVQPWSLTASGRIRPSLTEEIWTLPAWDANMMSEGLRRMEETLEKAQNGKLLPPTPLPMPPVAQLQMQINEWGFDVFCVPYNELPAVAYHVLAKHPAAEALSSFIDYRKLWRYVNEIAVRYQERPFHSFRHATDVLLASVGLIRLIMESHRSPFRDNLMVFALLVSALVHDTDHPGVMNGFVVAVNHPIVAMLDKPVAVLENHHARIALALLERPELNFVEKLSPEERERFVSLVRENVLNTDVTTTMPKLKEFEEGTKTRRPSLTVMKFEDRASKNETIEAKEVMCLIIKAADISNPSRPIGVYSKWIDGVMLEFFVQGDYERSHQMAFSMNCDRETVVIAKAQVGFITFLVAPVFNALATYAPSVRKLSEAVEANKQHFVALAAAS